MQKNQSRRLDWAKYTNFRSRNTRVELAGLCSSYSRSELRDIFSTYDKAGLCPIHWAAVNNRGDLIELMLDLGSPLRIACRNRLFANGSALHLAAMNGSLEAATVLLAACENPKQSEFKTLELDRPNEPQPAQRNESEPVRLSWLRERDIEGQTPLMRSAAPRSKRLDTVRDLLRKNMWSLSARPAEMALYLINRGADWRESESINSMNLLHLAIINDCDDIVALLLVLDRDLLRIRAMMKPNRHPKEQPVLQDEQPKSTGMISVDLNSQGSSESITSNGSSVEKPLVNKESAIKNRLVEEGILPVELAVIYCRVTSINLLWRAGLEQDELHGSEQVASKRDLKRVLIRACVSSKTELARVMRVVSLRALLAVDLLILMTFIIPDFLTYHDMDEPVLLSIRNGIFIVFLCLTLVLALRVMLKNPGYLRRSSLQYLSELRRLVGQTKSGEKKEEQRIIQTPSYLEPLEQVRLLCHKCRCVRRPRSRHCNFCNHCVQDFDHHCIYLGACIGRKNRFDFLLLLIMLTLVAIYGTVLQANAIDISQRGRFWQILALFWIAKYILIGSVAAFFLLRRACLGVTMYEEIRSSRIRKIFGDAGPPEAIEKSHKMYSIEKGSFWRYSPNRYLTGDLSCKQLLRNLHEFANFITLDEYLVSVACADTAVGRSISDNDPRNAVLKLA